MTFQRKYSDEQRGAIEQAWGDRNIRPARRIATLAAEGELTFDGELVDAFVVSCQTISDIGRRYLRRREKHQQRLIAQQGPKDSVEMVRRRLAIVIDEQLAYVERRQQRNRHHTITGEELRQIGRAARELAALPGPNGEAPLTRKPGAHDPTSKSKPDGHTRGGLAAQILRANEPQPITTAQASPPPQHHQHKEQQHSHPHPPTTNEKKKERNEEANDPGLFVRDRIAALEPTL
jgi:hypothetical protein